MASARRGRRDLSAFNFPVAVWSWNAALAAVCGDATVWKPSEKTPLTAIAVIKIAERVCRATGAIPRFSLCSSAIVKPLAQKLAADRRIPLVSATGSTRMGIDGRANGPWPSRHERIMELGGNNALIVCPSAALEMATQSIFLARSDGRSALHLHPSSHHVRVDRRQVARKLLAAYKSAAIGHPLDRKNLDGSVDRAARGRHGAAIPSRRLKDEGGEVLYGGERLDGEQVCRRLLHDALPGECETDFKIVHDETFGPLLYLLTYRDFDEAIAINNG